MNYILLIIFFLALMSSYELLTKLIVAMIAVSKFNKVPEQGTGLWALSVIVLWSIFYYLNL